MQKHRAVLIASLLSLTACAGTGVPAARDSYADKKAAEQSGWDRVENLAALQCGVREEPPARSDAVRVSTCVTGLIQRYVMPHAVAPAVLAASREEARRIAGDYAAGRISAAEYRRLSEERLKRYRYSLIYFANERFDSHVG